MRKEITTGRCEDFEYQYHCPNCNKNQTACIDNLPPCPACGAKKALFWPPRMCRIFQVVIARRKITFCVLMPICTVCKKLIIIRPWGTDKCKGLVDEWRLTPPKGRICAYTTKRAHHWPIKRVNGVYIHTNEAYVAP